MQVVRRALLLLHPDRRFQARVSQAAEREFEVRIVPSWEELRSTLGRSSLASVVIVDPYSGSGDTAPLAAELRALLEEFAGTAVIAALRIRAERYADLHTLGAWGVVNVIAVDGDDVAAIEKLLRSVRGRPLQNLLETALPDKLSRRARQILRAAAEVAVVGGQAADLARALHTSLRNLLRWCEGEGLPPPRQLLAWMRILLAAEMLDHPGRSVDDVASACGYAAESGLRRVCYDFLGMGPTEMRKAGAFTTASRAFRGVLIERPRSGAALLAGVNLDG